MNEPTHLKIRYRGKLIGKVWSYDKPKIVELPVPFVAKSEKTGEVACDPIGIFEYENGKALLEKSGPDGCFVLEEEVYPEVAEIPTVFGSSLETEPQQEERPVDRWGRPVRTEHEELIIRKKINRAKVKRGERQRAVRSDAGKPKPRKTETESSAVTPVQVQADPEEPSPERQSLAG
jgi:hypothetical protein